MSKKEVHVVIGASGGLGSALVRRLAEKGRCVRAVNRKGDAPVRAGVIRAAADANDYDSVQKAVQGAAVVYHAAHPSGEVDYSTFPGMTRNISAAAGEVGAKLVMASSAYVYGKVDGPMTEDLAYNPEAASGEYHALAADIVMEAHQKGWLRAAIGRGSNYFGPNVPQTWPGINVPAALNGEKASIIGRAGVDHTYTYVDDFAEALITLADNDAADGETWHVPSPDAGTTQEFLELLYREAGQELKIMAGGRLVLTIMGWFDAKMRSALEVLYQFEHPFVLEGSKFTAAFGGQPTPHPEAMHTTVDWFRRQPAADRQK